MNLQRARERWPIIERLLPMGFPYEICVLAIKCLNEDANIETISDWILQNQEKEMQSLQEYRATIGKDIENAGK
jgi:pyruvate-formate lyase-activating enzyme